MEGLVLWGIILLLLISSFFGKIGNKIAGKKGKYIGYTIPSLLFIGIVVYNVAEYYYIKNQVNNLCEKESGIFVYVTPEQWKEENKDSLNSLYQFDDIDRKDEKKYTEMENKKKEIEKNHKFFTYDNNKYKIWYIYNDRIVIYSNINYRLNYYTKKNIDLLVDIKTNKVLVKTVSISTGVGGFIQIKSWMNTIPNCKIIHPTSEIYRKFSNSSFNERTDK